MTVMMAMVQPPGVVVDGAAVVSDLRRERTYLELELAQMVVIVPVVIVISVLPCWNG